MDEKSVNSNTLKKRPSEKSTVDWLVTIISVTALFVFVAFMALKPDATMLVVDKLFQYTTNIVGVPILWFVFLGLFLSMYFAFSKYGKIKLGEGPPQYSLYSYVALMISACIASTAVLYSFVEWSWYYASPAFSIAPYSQAAAEMAMPYAFFHWGLSVQVIFVLTATAMAYGVYVRKIPLMRVSAICEAMMPKVKYKKGIGKVIDIITVFSIVGGLGVSLGLGVPLISAGVSEIFKIETSFEMNVIIVLVTAVVLSISAFVGIDRGLKRLADYSVYAAMGLILFIFIVGPTKFIVKQLTTSLGTMISNYVDMSLWTDPIANSGFPESNTIFLFTLALNYAALMGVFITKVSKGRTIKEMILTCLLGISGGTWIMFGVNSGFTMNAELSGKYILSAAENPQAALFEIFSLELPGGLIIPVIFTLILFVFMVAALDSAALSLASIASTSLDKHGNSHPMFRVFWCVMLAAVPLSIMFVGAPFGALKTICIFLSVPFLLVIIFMNVGLFKWFKEDSQNGVIEDNLKNRT